MPGIHLTTFIAAPAKRVFDLSRHMAMYKRIFQGRNGNLTTAASSNLLKPGETISVVGKVAGRNRLATLKVTKFEDSILFVEEQVKGDLKVFRHEHHFKQVDNGTIVIDLIEYDQPGDLPGKIFAKFYLRKLLETFVTKRNDIIRNYAETEKWRAILT